MNKAISTQKSGFTIIELLVIIVVIAILASLTAVSYGSWRNRAATTVTKSDLVMVANTMQQQRNFTNEYPLGLPSSFVPSQEVAMAWVSGSASTFCIEAASNDMPSIIYHISHVNQVPVSGGC